MKAYTKDLELISTRSGVFEELMGVTSGNRLAFKNNTRREVVLYDKLINHKLWSKNYFCVMHYFSIAAESVTGRIVITCTHDDTMDIYTGSGKAHKNFIKVV